MLNITSEIIIFDQWSVVCIYVCMYVWMDGWMDGWIDGWMLNLGFLQNRK
jgi:hypothetical protein